MSNIQYFQRYRGPENTHSSNALSLLNMLYNYSPAKFYEILGRLIDVQGELENVAPSFEAQDTKNGKGSIPDFSIMQQSFKIAVEAKEKSFDIDQLERHLINLSDKNKNDFKYKVLIALSPQNDVQDQLDELKKKFSDIYIVHKSYMDFYEIILGNLSEIKDYGFIEILEDYKDYCQQDKLVNYTNDTMMVRLTSQTYDFNFANGIYYDDCKSRPYGYRYLGLYKDKSVKAIGKIVKVVEAHIDENNDIKYGKLINAKSLTVEDKQKIILAIEHRKNLYHNETVPHWHFIVEKFIEVENFKKKKHALYGKKKFYLKEDFNIEDIKNCSIYDIAAAMKDYDKWE